MLNENMLLTEKDQKQFDAAKTEQFNNCKVLAEKIKNGEANDIDVYNYLFWKFCREDAAYLASLLSCLAVALAEHLNKKETND